MSTTYMQFIVLHRHGSVCVTRYGNITRIARYTFPKSTATLHVCLRMLIKLLECNNSIKRTTVTCIPADRGYSRGGNVLLQVYINLSVDKLLLHTTHTAKIECYITVTYAHVYTTTNAVYTCIATRVITVVRR